MDFRRIERLVQLVEAEPEVRTTTTVRVHIWPKDVILELSPTGSATFFLPPDDIYMPAGLPVDPAGRPDGSVSR